jgi:hypothetical protein
MDRGPLIWRSKRLCDWRGVIFRWSHRQRNIEENSKQQDPFRSFGDRAWSIKKSSHQGCRNAELRNRESALWISARSLMVVTSSKSCRENIEVTSSFFGVSEIATWRVEMPHNRIAEMRNTFWLSLWSQPLVTSVEDGGRS